MFPRKAQKKPRTCKHLLGRFSSVKKFPGRSRLLFLAEFLEARIIPERIEHWIEPEQRGIKRDVWRNRSPYGIDSIFCKAAMTSSAANT